MTTIAAQKKITKPTYAALLKFAKDVKAYTDRKCVEAVEHPRVFRKAMLNINLSAIKVLGDDQ